MIEIDVKRMRDNQEEYFQTFLSNVVKELKPSFIFEPACGPCRQDSSDYYTCAIKDNPVPFTYIGVDLERNRCKLNKDITVDPRFVYIVGDVKNMKPIGIDLLITKCFVCLNVNSAENLDYVIDLDFKYWVFMDTFMNEVKLDKVKDKCNIIKLENTVGDTYYGLVEKKK